MRKSPAGKRFGGLLLLAALLGGHSAYGQKPAPREVKVANPPPAATLPPGSYHALVIGINDYQSQSLPKLQTAVNDATALASLLQEQYGFTDVKLLRNATRSEILLALNDFKHNLPGNSNLLIYYAGHGYKDPGTKIAYWLPVDAQSDNDVNWIGASAITDEIKGLHSAHVLVISDSCYSGDLVRAPLKIGPEERGIYLRRMLESPSRTLMSSGSSEPVSDGGKDGHSIFAYALLQSLRSITDDGFTAGDLFHIYIQQQVGGGSQQLPQYGIILNSGHEFGDFVFSRGGKVVIPSDGPATASPEADRYAVNQVVNAYVDSYNRVNAVALWKIWPNPPAPTKQTIEAYFRSARSITLKLTDRRIEVNGANATAEAQSSQEFTPKNGSPQKSPSGPITLELSKVSGSWVITAVK